MNERYTKAVHAINEVALFLATEGYQVDAHFLSHHTNMSVTIYFNDIKDKAKIEHLLNDYANEHDVIRYQHHAPGNNFEFYTLTLYKNPS